MNFKSITSGLVFWTKKHLPEILVTTGFVATVGAGVVACVNTPKAVKAVSEAKEQIKLFESCANEGKCCTAEGKDVEYTEADAQHDAAVIRTAAVKAVVKAYAIPTILCAAGGVAIFSGYHQQKKATAAAVAYAGTLATSFAAYRENAKKRFGETVDGELLSGKWNESTYTTTEKTVTTNDNGETVIKEEEKTVTSSGDGSTSGYPETARVWSQETTAKWSELPGVSRMKLEQCQRFFTDELNVKGYVFLNDVYKWLGFKMSKNAYEKRLGWKAKRLGGKSGEIYLGIDDRTPEMLAFNAGKTPDCILTFNIDGDILDCLPE